MYIYIHANPQNLTNDEYIAERAGHALVREKINFNHRKNNQLNNEIRERPSSLHERITKDDDRKWIQKYLEKLYKKEFE